MRSTRIMARCNALARNSEEPGRITRPYGSPALAAAGEAVASWMREAGMTVHRDAIGNVRGRRDGTGHAAPALLLGSHLDSVRDAGRYDGPLGILVALEAVARVHEQGRSLPFPIEIVAFADEEGLRFQTTYLGSRALAGSFEPALLDRVDGDGATLREAIVACGGDPSAVPAAAIRAGEAFAYVEVHIEQGPHLEHIDAPVGVVEAIAGQTRALVTFTGAAGHAGTVGMGLRRDALAGAAELILATEQLARRTPDLVATVGKIDVEPGASNVIPGLARLTLDVRHPDDTIRVDAIALLESRANEIAVTRSLGVDWIIVQDNRAVPCDTTLAARLSAAVSATGTPVVRLSSGAGHDAVAMASALPVAMLFVRCAGGVSHNPAESVRAEDVAVAIDVLDRLIDALAAEPLA
jgi:hydantoinase/carbamoylase family amidase